MTSLRLIRCQKSQAKKLSPRHVAARGCPRTGDNRPGIDYKVNLLMSGFQADGRTSRACLVPAALYCQSSEQLHDLQMFKRSGPDGGPDGRLEPVIDADTRLSDELFAALPGRDAVLAHAIPVYADRWSKATADRGLPPLQGKLAEPGHTSISRAEVFDQGDRQTTVENAVQLLYYSLAWGSLPGRRSCMPASMPWHRSGTCWQNSRSRHGKRQGQVQASAS